MKDIETEKIVKTELPDSWWYRVYAGVILTLIVVILLLIAFTNYFS